MTTDVDIILSDTVVKQLEALHVYTVVKPGINLGAADGENVTKGHVCNTLSDSV